MKDEDKYYSNSIFWVETERISPNPYQPRKTFDEMALNSLAESIRQYGVLQPLVVTRKETDKPDGGISVDYELISGERRLRASKIAGVHQVPVVIRASEETDKMKLELAIIENLQREDLNPVDRAKAFQQLYDNFKLTHIEIGRRVGKSREYVSNTLRILLLPEYVLTALSNKEISEGHTRPILMLSDRPDEQRVLFQEIIDKNVTVRDAEKIARRIAVDKARKQDLTPELLNMERELTETLGTRVTIEQKERGGKVRIDFFSAEDLEQIRQIILDKRAQMNTMNSETQQRQNYGGTKHYTEYTDKTAMGVDKTRNVHIESDADNNNMLHEEDMENVDSVLNNKGESEDPMDMDDDMYSIKNFSL